MEKIAILIATFNGANYIGRTLESIRNARMDDFSVEIVVVDNGSTDQTREIVQGFSGSPKITYLYCPEKGKSRALNYALEQLSVDLMLFTDDDVEVGAEWVIRMAEAARENPDFDLFGGAVLAKWQSSPPEWLRYLVEERGLMAVTGPNLLEGYIDPEAIKGPNMMIRQTRVTKKVSFREDVGPDGTKLYPMGSETSYLLTAAHQGARAMAVPKSIVYHLIRTNQLSLKYILLRYVRHGRGWARMKPENRPAEFRQFAGFPLFILRKAILGVMRSFWCLLMGNKKSAVDAAISSAYDIGVGIELRYRAQTLGQETGRRE